jgi:hypothetical protein
MNKNLLRRKIKNWKKSRFKKNFLKSDWLKSNLRFLVSYLQLFNDFLHVSHAFSSFRYFKLFDTLNIVIKFIPVLNSGITKNEFVLIFVNLVHQCASELALISGWCHPKFPFCSEKSKPLLKVHFCRDIFVILLLIKIIWLETC